MTIRAWQVQMCVREREREGDTVFLCVCAALRGATSTWRRRRKSEQNQRAAAAHFIIIMAAHAVAVAAAAACNCHKKPANTHTHTQIHTMAHANLFFRLTAMWSISSWSFWHWRDIDTKMLLNKFSLSELRKIPQHFSVSSDTDIFHSALLWQWKGCNSLMHSLAPLELWLIVLANEFDSRCCNQSRIIRSQARFDGGLCAIYELWQRQVTQPV